MPFLPFQITEEIINVALFQDDLSFSATKTCALVCHDFLHLCRKHIFAFINLNGSCDEPPPRRPKATTLMLQQLLDTTPELADYICNLVYNVTSDDLRNGSLVETFRKITRLKSFCVQSHRLPRLQWDNNSLRPALLHLLHLPTLISFKMQFIDNFLFSDLAPCINLEQLNFAHLAVSNDEISTSNPPKKSIRLRDISAGFESNAAVKKMCAMHCADGKSFINFSCVNNLVVRLREPNEVQASLDLLNRCKNLASVNLVCDSWPRVNLTHIGLVKILYPTMQTLKHLHMRIFFDERFGGDDPLAGLCNMLDEMKNKNIIETITIGVFIGTGSDCTRGDEWGRLDAALEQPGWPKLRQVSLGIIIRRWERANDDLECALKQLPQTQFPKLSSSKSLSFGFSVCEKRV